jgi:hypothetical protein
MVLSHEDATKHRVHLLKVTKDEKGKVWLFYCEAQSHARGTFCAKLEDRGDYIGVRFRLWELEDKPPSIPSEDEILPIDITRWLADRPSSEDSPEIEELDEKTDELGCQFIGVLELPYFPTKELRLVND